VNGDNPYAQYQLGLAAFTGGDVDTAATALERATQLKPDFAYAHYYAGQAFQKQRNISKAGEHYQYFLKLAPDSPDRAAIQAIVRAMRG
jgi:Tfp pilus assembly protein PilF